MPLCWRSDNFCFSSHSCRLDRYLIVLAYGLFQVLRSFRLSCRLNYKVFQDILIAHGVVGSVDSELGSYVHGKLAPLWHIDRTSVADPDSLNPYLDPDQACQVNPDPGLNDQKIRKKYRWNFFISKMAIYLFLGLLKGRRTSKLQEKPSALKREHPTSTSKMQFIKFFLSLSVIFALLVPDFIRISNNGQNTSFLTRIPPANN